MAKAHQNIEWPSDDEIVRLVAEHGYADAATALGVSRTGLQDYAKRRELKDKIREAKTVKIEVDEESIAVTDPKRIRITQLEAIVKQVRAENRDYEKALASQHELIEQIVELTRVPVEVPKFKVAKQPKRDSHRSIIAPIFDLQYGQLVRPEDTPGGRGGFSTAIFDERLERYVDGLTGVMRHHAQNHVIDELIFALGGDFVEGDEIYGGMPWQLEIDPIRQMIEISSKLGDAIQTVVRFAKEELGVPKIACFGVPGNHGKVGGKRGGARPAEYNWDYGALEMMKDRLRAEPIDMWVNHASGHLLFSAADFIFLMIHGDEIKGWGGLPFYGLSKFDGRAMRLHQTMHDYLLMGHHHQAATIPNGSGETIVSGDWVGANNLSRIITAASRPHQAVISVGRNWGITGIERLWFTRANDAYAPSPVHRIGESDE